MAKGIQYRNRIDLSTAIRREIIKVPISGFLQIVDASSSSATIKVALDNDVSDAKFFSMKKGGEIKDIDGFSKVYISCDAQPGEWVDMIIVEGSEDFSVKNPQEIVINSISNAVKVKNETGGSLEVNNPNIEALLKNDTDQRAPLSVLGGYVVGASNTTAVQTLISPGVNTNGLIIRGIQIVANSTTTHSVYADTSAPASATDVTKRRLATVRDARFYNSNQPIYIPAGIGIYSVATSATGTGTNITIEYDLL